MQLLTSGRDGDFTDVETSPDADTDGSRDESSDETDDD